MIVTWIDSNGQPCGQSVAPEAVNVIRRVLLDELIDWLERGIGGCAWEDLYREVHAHLTQLRERADSPVDAQTSEEPEGCGHCGSTGHTSLECNREGRWPEDKS